MEKTTYQPPQFTHEENVLRGWVISILHPFNTHKRMFLTTREEANIRYECADGFGNLYHENGRLPLVAMPSDSPIHEKVWDWSHVRDSSPAAFRAMTARLESLGFKR